MSNMSRLGQKLQFAKDVVFGIGGGGAAGDSGGLGSGGVKQSKAAKRIAAMKPAVSGRPKKSDSSVSDAADDTNVHPMAKMKLENELFLDLQLNYERNRDNGVKPNWSNPPSASDLSIELRRRSNAAALIDRESYNILRHGS